MHGDGPACGDAREAADQSLFSLLLHAQLGHGHRVCVQVQARDTAVRLLPAHDYGDLGVSGQCNIILVQFIDINVNIRGSVEF